MGDAIVELSLKPLRNLLESLLSEGSVAQHESTTHDQALLEELQRSEACSFTVAARALISFCCCAKVRVRHVYKMTSQHQCTVRTALLLVTLPIVLVTVTAKRLPLSAIVVGGVVYDDAVAPGMLMPFFVH